MSERMKLRKYFEKAQGIGVLLPIDASGQVNQAIYGRPRFMDDDDDGNCLFITSKRLSHDNVRPNPSASYLFIEEAEGYVGKQLSLTVIEDESAPEKTRRFATATSPRQARRKASISFMSTSRACVR
jgi:hypothetical protein